MRIKLQHAHTIDGPVDLGEQIPESRLRQIGFYFEIQADGNHETILTSEIYNTHQAAMHAIDLLCFNGFQAELHDLTLQPSVSPPPPEG